MISRIPKSIFLILALLLGLGLYWPSMHGEPVWDDLSYMFKYNVVIRDFSYLTIWTEFSWPLSVSVQKVLFSWWKYEYLYYHLLNFLLHSLNAILLLKFAEKLKLPFARVFFLLFLLHPANVIAVSWMIQLKTLLSFFFSLISFFFLMKVEENKKWYLPSWFFFLLSLLSKTSSILLPFVFLIYLYKKIPRKELLWLIPFFLFSIGASWRILLSPVKQTSVGQIKSRHLDPIDAESNIQAPHKYNPEGKLTRNRVGPPDTFADTLFRRSKNFVSTIHYYFWQTLLPLENQPVKGLNYSAPGMLQFVHLIFLILIFIILWRTPSAIYLVCGYLMMFPFVGIIDAPYMNLAWVSDQHLYLALPFFLCFWLSLISKWKMKYAPLVPLMFLPIYCYKVAVSTPLYKDEIVFYNSCLEADPLNVPIAYNLAIAYMNKGDINQALNVTSSMVYLPEVAPEILDNRYFPYLYILHQNLKDIIEKKSP